MSLKSISILFCAFILCTGLIMFTEGAAPVKPSLNATPAVTAATTNVTTTNVSVDVTKNVTTKVTKVVKTTIPKTTVTPKTTNKVNLTKTQVSTTLVYKDPRYTISYDKNWIYSASTPDKTQFSLENGTYTFTIIAWKPNLTGGLQQFVAGVLDGNEKQLKDFKLISNKTTKLSDKDAVQLVYSYTENNEALETLEILTVKDDTYYQIHYVAPVSLFDGKAVAANDMFTSFKLL